MCLAIPGRIIEVDGERAWVDFQGNRAAVNSVLTPGVQPDDWVLVHAGFAITTIDADAARETWSYLQQIGSQEIAEAIGRDEVKDG